MAKISFYFDEMMPRTPAEQLLQKGYIVVMAVDVEMIEKDDEEHLAYSAEHEHILVTFDRPFAGRTAKTANHHGLICLSGRQDDFGMIVRKLINLAEDYAIEDIKGQVFWF